MARFVTFVAKDVIEVYPIVEVTSAVRLAIDAIVIGSAVVNHKQIGIIFEAVQCDPKAPQFDSARTDGAALANQAPAWPVLELLFGKLWLDPDLDCKRSFHPQALTIRYIQIVALAIKVQSTSTWWSRGCACSYLAVDARVIGVDHRQRCFSLQVLRKPLEPEFLYLSVVIRHIKTESFP